MPDDDHLDETEHERDGVTDQVRNYADRPSFSVRDVFTALLLIFVVAGLVGVIYVALTPQQAADTYTEFYILGDDGNASDYPTNLTVEEQATVTVGIANHEQQRTKYAVVVRSVEETLATRTITVDRGQRWEGSVSYSVDQPGRTEVRFLLYREGNSGPETPPYRELRLWTNVSSSRS